MSSTPKTTTRRALLAGAATVAAASPVALPAVAGLAAAEPVAATALSGLAAGVSAVPVEPSDATLLALVDEYLAAYAEHDRLNDVIEEAVEQKRWAKLTQAERDAAKRALDEANERIYRGLLPRLEEMPARTLAGAIGKAKVVITELPDCFEHALSLSFARDVLALEGRAQS
jgi:hypothetical protein